MRRQLKAGSRPATILRRLNVAIGSGFHPRGDDADEREDFEKAFLQVQLGGQRNLRLSQMTESSMGQGKLKKWLQLESVPRFLLCHGELHCRTMVANMEGSLFASEPHERACNVLALDNVNVDERLRHYGRVGVTGGIRGVGRETASMVPSFFPRTYSALAALGETLATGQAKLAKEVTVMAIIRNGRGTQQIVPIFASGTCCSGGDDVQAHVWMCENAIRLWYDREEGYKTRGPISTVSSDSGSTLRKAMRQMFHTESLPQNFRDLFANCLGFDLAGHKEHGMTDNADDKHDFKNVRACLARKKGAARILTPVVYPTPVCKGTPTTTGIRMHSISTSREQLMQIILDGTDYSREQVAAMLPAANKGDHQNVSAPRLVASRLIRETCSVKAPRSPTARSPLAPCSLPARSPLAPLPPYHQIVASSYHCIIVCTIISSYHRITAPSAQDDPCPLISSNASRLIMLSHLNSPQGTFSSTTTMSLRGCSELPGLSAVWFLNSMFCNWRSALGSSLAWT